MNKILPKFFTAAVLCFGMLSAHADNVTIRLATSLSPGAKLTFALPLNTRVSVDWGDGEVKSYRDSVVTGTLAGDTVTISGTSQLSSFDCHEQNVKWLDITQAPDLVSLDCSDNELTTLDLTKTPRSKSWIAPTTKSQPSRSPKQAVCAASTAPAMKFRASTSFPTPASR